MELRHLRYLATVVDERSVSRAADRLGMTQPPLSSAIQQVEKEVGTPLLVRHARGVEPTEAGRYLAGEIRQILRHLDDAVARTAEVGEGRVGRISIAAEPIASWGWLPAVARAFTAGSPDVALDVAAYPPEGVTDSVRAERVTVGMLYTVESAVLAKTAAAGLQTAVSRREPLVLALPADHRLASSPVVDLHDLAEDRWVIPRPTPAVPGIAELLTRAWSEAGTAPRAASTTATPAEALALVTGAGCVAALPASVRSVATSGVRLAMPHRPLGDLEAVVVWRDETPTAALREFLSSALRAPEPDQLGSHLARPVSTEAELAAQFEDPPPTFRG
jgi:DNA-binding transcriptional LysR family regulator